MQSASNKKFKLSNCKLMLAILFTICMFTIAFPITAHAETNLGDNAGGDGSAGAHRGAEGGATQNNHGYRFYVVDSSGKVVSKVVDFQSIEGIRCDIEGTTTRIGNGKASKTAPMPDGMPRPFYHNGRDFRGNGEALRQWCLSDGEDGHQRLVNLMHNYLGESILELFEDSAYEYYVVLEPITWHDLFRGDSDSNIGKSFYGTFYNWMQFYSANNWPQNFTSPLDQKVLGTCLQLVRDEPPLGLTNPGEYTEYFTLSNVGDQGWGIHLYYNQEMIETQTTCNEDVGDKPHPAPPESSGKIMIVKNYRYSNDGGGTFVDGGCYVKEKTSGKIVIEQEQSYKIKEWRVSTDIKKSIYSLKWEEAVNNWDKNGTEAGELDLTGKVGLYILYEKVDESELQTTRDENAGDRPHLAPDESTGTVTIIKNYRYSEDGGSTFKDAGCFVKDNKSGKIKIEQEQSYKIKEWRVSTDIKRNVNSVNWESEVNNWNRKDNRAGIITLAGKVGLYILYEKVDEPETTAYDFEIPESYITKQVYFSQAANTSNTEMTAQKFTQTNIEWVSSAFSACPGHEVFSCKKAIHTHSLITVKDPGKGKLKCGYKYEHTHGTNESNCKSK